MNGSKTEFIMFGHRKQLQKCITSSINIDGDSFNRLHIVKYLGALLDEELTLKQHIQHKCKSAMYTCMGFTELNQLGQVSQRMLRRYLHWELSSRISTTLMQYL